MVCLVDDIKLREIGDMGKSFMPVGKQGYPALRARGKVDLTSNHMASLFARTIFGRYGYE
jgi:hypothetical protein